MCSDRQDICSAEDKVDKSNFESIMCATNDCQISECCDTRDRCIDSDCSDYGGGWSEKWKKNYSTWYSTLLCWNYMSKKY